MVGMGSELGGAARINDGETTQGGHTHQTPGKC